MSSLKKFFGSVFILSGLIYAVWALLGGGIDFYPNQNYIQESPLQELLNISLTLMVIIVPGVVGFMILLRNRKKAKI